MNVIILVYRPKVRTYTQFVSQIRSYTVSTEKNFWRENISTSKHPTQTQSNTKAHRSIYTAPILASPAEQQKSLDLIMALSAKIAKVRAGVTQAK